MKRAGREEGVERRYHHSGGGREVSFGRSWGQEEFCSNTAQESRTRREKNTECTGLCVFSACVSSHYLSRGSEVDKYKNLHAFSRHKGMTCE